MDQVVRFEPWPGALCCVLGQDTTLTTILSTQVFEWVPANLILGCNCNGLASNPGGVQLLLVASCYRNHRTYFTVKENSSPAPPVMLTWQYFGSSQDSGAYSEQEDSVNPATNPHPTTRFSLLQARVVRKMDNAIHWINHYPADSVVCFVNTYPLDSDLSGG